jgi:hypothetical protein
MASGGISRHENSPDARHKGRKIMRVLNRTRTLLRSAGFAGAIALLTCALPAAAATPSPKPKFTKAVAFDVSKPLRQLSAAAPATLSGGDGEPLEIRPEPDIVEPVQDNGFTGDAAQGGSVARHSSISSLTISSPLANFEGISNQDNFNIFGFRVNPPDPVGDVGPNHYVEMVNLAFAVYDKQGNLLLGPADSGSLWADFAIEDCTDPSGDPIVIYDQLKDRWILSQFTTRGLFAAVPFYNCVAVSQSGDPTGAYYRYAFITQPDTAVADCWYFPDYPKYGVWTNSYILTTRDFGCTATSYGISVYALEKYKMIEGNPNARAVQFFLDSNLVPLNLIGDGLLPPDIDGSRRPKDGIAAPIVGTQDDGSGYGGTFDAINVFDLKVLWNSKPVASLNLAAQLPVAAFDSIFPCVGDGGNSRDCLPQPGVGPTQELDILSYRQRPTHRLAYRNFGTHESLVTNQSVEASPGVAGVRWYEVRRTNGVYSVHQQGTYAPGDGVHRWMGSAAMDGKGNLAVGYSVVDGTTVFPGIRYAGRLSSDPLGSLALGEATVINGTGVQTTTNSRWGDYTSLNIDPVDDCTFWYVNEYYTAAGQASSAAGWQTRIASFELPGCD